MSLDGALLGAPVPSRGIDLYGPTVTPSGAIWLGNFALTAGRHKLELRVIGRNPASTGYSVCIDYLTLAPRFN